MVSKLVKLYRIQKYAHCFKREFGPGYTIITQCGYEDLKCMLLYCKLLLLIIKSRRLESYDEKL